MDKHDFHFSDATNMERLISQTLVGRLEGECPTQPTDARLSVVVAAFGDDWTDPEQRTLFLHKMISYLVDFIPVNSFDETIDKKAIHNDLLDVLQNHFGKFIDDHRFNHEDESEM